MLRLFLLWLAGVTLGFGALAGGAHAYLSAAPTRVLVVVDSAFAMREAWDRVPAALDALDDDDYAVFQLRSEKAATHAWRDTLALGPLAPYGPRDLSGLAALETGQADQRILITNAPAAALPPLDGWRVVRP